MKQCANFKQYKKILRKYCNKMWKKTRGFWCVWLSYKITTIEQINEVKSSKYWTGNLKYILNEFAQYKDKLLYFDGPNEMGILVGIELTNEDYYYMYKTDAGIRYESCVGGFIDPDTYPCDSCNRDCKGSCYRKKKYDLLKEHIFDKL